jgi:uracil-DNA glycosylase family 4
MKNRRPNIPPEQNLPSFEAAIFAQTPWHRHLDWGSIPENPRIQEEDRVVASDAKTVTGIKIVFVLDCADGNVSSFTESEEGQLLSKMIAAMGLSEGEFRSIALERSRLEDPASSGVHDEILRSGARVVVCLGSMVTHALMGSLERLSKIHGQCFEKSFATSSGDVVLNIVPLFHPSYLLINPNMKKTAWNDLQKVMTLIGK